MLFVVRHGERADFAGDDEKKKIQIPFDPHLTDLGKIQARKAGNHIIRLLKEYHKEDGPKPEELKYLIISSPFRRCIQTAYHISQALPKENIWGSKIYLNEFLSEHLDPLYYEKNVLPDLQVRTNIDEVKKVIDIELQDGFPEAGNHFSTPIFPEKTTIYHRVPKGYDGFKPHFFGEINKENNVVVILVSHMYVVEVFLDMHKALDYNKGVDYTCLSQYTIEKNGLGKPIVTQYHEQLDEAQEEYEKVLEQSKQ